jgi:hypothetical protein
MNSDAQFWTTRFHWCALAAGFIAASEDRLDDALYVRELAYSLYEEGAFRDHARCVQTDASVAA